MNQKNLHSSRSDPIEKNPRTFSWHLPPLPFTSESLIWPSSSKAAIAFGIVVLTLEHLLSQVSTREAQGFICRFTYPHYRFLLVLPSILPRGLRAQPFLLLIPHEFRSSLSFQGRFYFLHRTYYCSLSSPTEELQTRFHLRGHRASLELSLG